MHPLGPLPTLPPSGASKKNRGVGVKRKGRVRRERLGLEGRVFQLHGGEWGPIQRQLGPDRPWGFLDPTFNARSSDRPAAKLLLRKGSLQSRQGEYCSMLSYVQAKTHGAAYRIGYCLVVRLQNRV